MLESVPRLQTSEETLTQISSDGYPSDLTNFDSEDEDEVGSVRSNISFNSINEEDLIKHVERIESSNKSSNFNSDSGIKQSGDPHPQSRMSTTTSLNPDVTKLDFLIRFKTSMGNKKSIPLKIGNKNHRVIYFKVDRETSFIEFMELILSYDQYMAEAFIPSNNKIFMGKNSNSKEFDYKPIKTELEYYEMMNSVIKYKKRPQKIIRTVQLRHKKHNNPQTRLDTQNNSEISYNNDSENIHQEDTAICRVCGAKMSFTIDGKCALHHKEIDKSHTVSDINHIKNKDLTSPVKLHKHIPNNQRALKLHRLRCLEGAILCPDILLAIPRLYFHNKGISEDNSEITERLELSLQETILCESQCDHKKNNTNVSKLINKGEYKLTAQCLRSSGIVQDPTKIQREMGKLFPKYNLSAQEEQVKIFETDIGEIDREEILKAIHSIKTKTTTDIYGWNVHMLENAVESKKFLKVFTSIISSILKEELYFNDFKLICLEKEKGMRPIVIGPLFMKITKRIIFARIGPAHTRYVTKFQYGVGVRNGCSSIAHQVREKLDDGQKVFSIDFTNDYNKINITACLKDKPELIPFAQYYNNLIKSKINAINGKSSFIMERGVTQGWYSQFSPILFGNP
eukprot:TRINITY_DN3245_c2_g1_i3.p1 TRINITY_DN3245_c2_g1~~TRINITY_DN3245_c2_g1_i3.p1  ORF type:complete len:625 (-),score=15.62 TRINITY_DN3245_c2_g1_i3:832-2706(-)